MPHAQHAVRILQAVRANIGPQQRELDQIELCAAAADALEFADNRFKRLDCGGEIATFESGEGARHRRNEGAGGITAVAPEFVDLPCMRLQRRPIAGRTDRS